jgi:probable lipoprotein NlpC
MHALRLYRSHILILFFIVLSGCARQHESRSIGGISAVDLNDTPLVRKTLYSHYRQWQGIPYKWGGMDKNGVDCSGFVYLTFRTRFGIQIPRTTEEQIEIGQDVTGRQLKPGDLVFFSTGFYDRHVGIYLENRNFIHASKSQGVMLSSLDDQYWQSNFRKAKRIRTY